MTLKYLIFITVVTTVLAVQKSYDGYKVFKIVPKTNEEVVILKDAMKNGLGQFWEEDFGVYNEVKIMVSPNRLDEFVMQMKDFKIESEEVIDNLQRVIENQMKPASRTTRSTSVLLSMTWDRYHPLEDIYNWFDELVDAYPDIINTVEIGTTVQNRQIKGVVINYHPERNDTLRGMLEGGLHAREWISPATLTWIIKEFLTSTDREVRALAENFEWHIFPVVNPDGYVYTFTNDRMWRKNRNTANAKNCTTDNDMSNGVDLNRNFGFMWMTVGASNDSCTNTFAGPEAFSENESRAIAQHVQTLKAARGKLIYYIAFHSYTQLVIVPYSHLNGDTDVLEANNYADMYEIAVRSAAKLEERFGTPYRTGVSAVVMYPMSGTSFDWVKYDADVPVTYLLELRDLGAFGFLLPPEEIIPNNLEIMDFLLEMDRNTRVLGYYTGAASLCSSLVTLLIVASSFCLISSWT